MTRKKRLMKRLTKSRDNRGEHKNRKRKGLEEENRVGGEGQAQDGQERKTRIRIIWLRTEQIMFKEIFRRLFVLPVMEDVKNLCKLFS